MNTSMNVLYALAFVGSIQLLTARSIGEDEKEGDITAIDNCRMTIRKRPGEYLLRAVSAGYWPHCSLKLKSPPNTKIKVTLKDTNTKCRPDTVNLEVLDGWLSYGGSFWPTNNARQLCGDVPEAVLLDQNVAEVFYKLSDGEFVLIQVDFEPNDYPCNVWLQNEDFGKNITVSAVSADEQQQCKIRLPGRSEVALNVNIEPDNIVSNEHKHTHICKLLILQCDETSVSVRNGRSAVNYHTKTTCTAGNFKEVMPCSYAEVVVQFSGRQPSESVSVLASTFAIDEPIHDLAMPTACYV